ncbi:ABC transporter ATP-binding protein [Litoreibacter roseus]|uniref:ABC transporter ATP-binding protein n=1 Tax=Litoreibacter roseus TaxID=2601869 RepID=A0A6N6JFG8_9RHOB|nr:ABC transporter ATP-binding protein [Litoreibacter roseus]GFE64966.1 ABC transporter ATP-binding protein [Litoreibacter roseus]
MSDALLDLRDVRKVYGDPDTGLVALNDLSLTIRKDEPEIVTIAGESGSGKSTLANLVLGFTRPTSGQIMFDGTDVGNASAKQMKAYHRQVQAVFQDPFGSYNPFYRVGHVFDMVIRNFKLSSNKTEARQMMEEALNAVGLTGDDVLRKYPHQLSGGQRQRIMMARAYMVKPRLIVADEPVSMVDASLRASILDVMMRLRDEGGISFLYVTHDLSTAYQVGDRILLFYQGTLVEHGKATDVISNPQHPYVQLLIDSVPKPDPTQRWQGEIILPAEEELRTAHSTGCRFVPRCPHAQPACSAALPPAYEVGPRGHRAACILHAPPPQA